MANFIEYKYHISNNSELFECTDQFAKQLKAIFQEAYLKGSIDLQYTEKDEEGNIVDTYIYPNDVKMVYEGVVTLQIHEHKIKWATPEHGTEKTEQHDDYPWIWVVIDTRPNSQFIFVQKKAEAFSGKTEFVVKDLIGNFISKALNLNASRYEIDFEVAKCHGGQGQIWNVVKHRTKNGADRLKTMVVRFGEKREAPKEERPDKFMWDILEKFKSDDAELQLWASKESNDNMQEIMPDMIGVAEQLLQYDYIIRLGFLHSGSIECSRDAQAIYGVQDSLISQFGTSNSKNGICQRDLIMWIDEYIVTDILVFYDKIGKYKRPKRSKKQGA